MARPATKSKTKKMCLYIELDLLEKIKALALREERYISYTTNKILKEYFEKSETKEISYYGAIVPVESCLVKK